MSGSGSQSFEFKMEEKVGIWRIKKFQGGTEETFRVKMIVSDAHADLVRKEVGPLRWAFLIQSLSKL